MKRYLRKALYRYVAMPLMKMLSNDLQEELALDTIRNLAKDSVMVGKFQRESDIAWRDEDGNMDDMQSLIVQNVCDLLSLTSLQGHSGYSIGFLKHYYDLGVNMKCISPLRFTDDEWGEYCGPEGNESAQNRRMSCIFKQKDGIIDDINALSWYDAARIDVDGTKDFDAYHGFFHGCVFVIRDMHADEVIKACVNIKNRTRFTGDNQNNVVPTIEVYDKTDTHNDFFCHICLESSIPPNFYKDYELIDGYNEEHHREQKEWIENHLEEMKLFCREAEEHYNNEKNR